MSKNTILSSLFKENVVDLERFQLKVITIPKRKLSQANLLPVQLTVAGIHTVKA